MNNKKENIINTLLKIKLGKSSEIHSEIIASGEIVSLITIKRLLSKLAVLGFIAKYGSGRGTKYELTNYGYLMANIDAHSYCSIDPDKRFGRKDYNFSLFDSLSFEIFTKKEIDLLTDATKKYQIKIKNVSETIREKELERFIIELSWKSSKIEGNTYTLLDTEKLIKDGVPAQGHSKDEAVMILNHKNAFKFILDNKEKFKTITKINLEMVHKILIKNLNVKFGFRSKMIGVTGSIYHPLDNIYQISEAVEKLCKSVSKIKNPYIKALISLLGISYIQPFEDGNKRTSRLITNAILLANNYAPLSYRSVDENIYREAMLVFYEINSLIPFKKIFLEQYIFATENYLVN